MNEKVIAAVMDALDEALAMGQVERAQAQAGALRAELLTILERGYADLIDEKLSRPLTPEGDFKRRWHSGQTGWPN